MDSDERLTDFNTFMIIFFRFYLEKSSSRKSPQHWSVSWKYNTYTQTHTLFFLGHKPQRIKHWQVDGRMGDGCMCYWIKRLITLSHLYHSTQTCWQNYKYPGCLRYTGTCKQAFLVLYVLTVTIVYGSNSFVYFVSCVKCTIIIKSHII